MTILRAVVLAGVLAIGLGLPLAVQAQEAEDPAASRSATFQAVEGPTTEDVPGGPLLVGAYGVVMVLLVGYVMWLARLQSVTTRDIDRLRKALSSSPTAASAAADEAAKKGS